MKMKFALNPQWRGHLYTDLQRLTPHARTARLVTLATVGLALRDGPVPLLPGQRSGSNGGEAPDTAEPLLLRVVVTPDTTPELYQALQTLEPLARRDAFLAWTQAGLALLRRRAVTPVADAPTPPPTRPGRRSDTPRPAARAAGVTDTAAQGPAAAPPSDPAPPPAAPARRPPDPGPAGPDPTPPPPDSLRRLVRNMGLGG